MFFLLFCTLATFLSPMLANSKPLLLLSESKIYFPIFIDYTGQDFAGLENEVGVDYRAMAQDPRYFSVWPLIKWDPLESNQNLENFPGAPSKANWLGTDDRGRDVFVRLLYGFKYSLTYAFLVWLISAVLGIVTGGTMGYFGGKLDFFGQRVVEVLSTIPLFPLLIILISIFSPTLFLLIAISSLFGWIGISYYIRAEFLKFRMREFVEAAKAMGASHTQIIFKHILPNSLTPIITFAPFAIAGEIVGLASLDYLGFGLQVPTPSWGELLNQAQKNYSHAWWLALYPSLALFLVLTALNFIGAGVRDAMDPHA